MPTYDYACERCGPFIARQAIALFDRPAPCPVCRTESVRALSVPAMLGSRRYRTGDQAAPCRADDARYVRLRHAGACGCCAPSVHERDLLDGRQVGCWVPLGFDPHFHLPL